MYRIPFKIDSVIMLSSSSKVGTHINIVVLPRVFSGKFRKNLTAYKYVAVHMGIGSSNEIKTRD